LQQVGGFLRVLLFPSPIKLITEVLLKVVLNTITVTLYLRRYEHNFSTNTWLSLVSVALLEEYKTEAP
jgi:hypothetical protein